MAGERVKNVHDERIVLPDKHRAGGFPSNAVRGGNDPLRSDQSSATVREAGRRPDHRLPRPVALLGSRAPYDPGIRPQTAWTCCRKIQIDFNGFAGVSTARSVHHPTVSNCCGLQWGFTKCAHIKFQQQQWQQTRSRVCSIDFVITKWTRPVPLSRDQPDSPLSNVSSPGGGGVLGGAGVLGGGGLLGGGLTPMCWSIQLRNLDTRANTVNRSFAEHLGEPQLTAPCSTQRPLAFWHTYGPPLSPWQPLKMAPSFPAHSIWSVIFSDDPPVGAITIDKRRSARKSVAFRIPTNVSSSSKLKGLVDDNWPRLTRVPLRRTQNEKLRWSVWELSTLSTNYWPGEAASFWAHTSLGTGGIWACCRVWWALPGCLIFPQPGEIEYSVNVWPFSPQNVTT